MQNWALGPQHLCVMILSFRSVQTSGLGPRRGQTLFQEQRLGESTENEALMTWAWRSPLPGTGI